MTNIIVPSKEELTAGLHCPECKECGAESRLIGVEPDPVIERTDLYTYQCLICGEMQTRQIQLPSLNGTHKA